MAAGRCEFAGGRCRAVFFGGTPLRFVLDWAGIPAVRRTQKKKGNALCLAAGDAEYVRGVFLRI